MVHLIAVLDFFKLEYFFLYECARWGQHIPAEDVQVCCRQSLALSFLVLMFLFYKPRVLFALGVMGSPWGFHDRPLDMSAPSTSHRKRPPGHDHAVCMKKLKSSKKFSFVPLGT